MNNDNTNPNPHVNPLTTGKVFIELLLPVKPGAVCARCVICDSQGAAQCDQSNTRVKLQFAGGGGAIICPKALEELHNDTGVALATLREEAARENGD